MSVLHYYKNLKPLETKVRIIYPSSDTLELSKFSNLTFGEYLAGTIPVFFVRSSYSYSYSSLLRRAREDCVIY